MTKGLHFSVVDTRLSKRNKCFTKPDSSNAPHCYFSQHRSRCHSSFLRGSLRETKNNRTTILYSLRNTLSHLLSLHFERQHEGALYPGTPHSPPEGAAAGSCSSRTPRRRSCKPTASILSGAWMCGCGPPPGMVFPPIRPPR